MMTLCRSIEGALQDARLPRRRPSGGGPAVPDAIVAAAPPRQRYFFAGQQRLGRQPHAAPARLHGALRQLGLEPAAAVPRELLQHHQAPGQGQAVPQHPRPVRQRHRRRHRRASPQSRAESSCECEAPPPVTFGTKQSVQFQSSNLSIEEFHHSLQDVTNFPLRPFVLPFLRTHLPLLQREIHALARANKQVRREEKIIRQLLSSVVVLRKFSRRKVNNIGRGKELVCTSWINSESRRN
jgi:hypothetical protein